VLCFLVLLWQPVTQCRENVDCLLRWHSSSGMAQQHGSCSYQQVCSLPTRHCKTRTGRPYLGLRLHLLDGCFAGCTWLQELPALPIQLEELACNKLGELLLLL
jgi:hypothetical protein